MSESLEQRLRRHAKDSPDKLVSFYPGDVLELLASARRTPALAEGLLTDIRNLLYDYRGSYQSNSCACIGYCMHKRFNKMRDRIDVALATAL